MTPLLLIQQALKQRSKATELDAIDRIAARLDPQLRKRFLAAVKASRKAVDLEALAKAIEVGDVSQAALAAKLQEWPERYGDLAFDLRAGFVAGAEMAYDVLDGARYRLRFDLVNPHAVRYSERHLPQIVESFKDNARQIIRDIISDAVGGKYTPQSAAREIRDHIGLTDRYSRAVERYRDELLLDGLYGDRLEAKVGKYADKLLRSRAKTIARTEIIQAQVEGQRALWQEAANNGLFSTLTARRAWKAHQDERTCPVCMDLDGQEIAFDGIYAGGFKGPPAHPNCRCSEDLLP